MFIRRGNSSPKKKAKDKPLALQKSSTVTLDCEIGQSCITAQESI